MPANIPEGYTTVTPWIISRDTAKLIEFVTAAFGADEIARVPNERGGIGHAEFRIGDAVVMGFDAKSDWPSTPAFLRLFVDNADETHARALAAGATSVTEVTPLFWGDRVGRVRDPFGNLWWIQARVEDVDPAELGRRASDPEWLHRMAYVQDSLEIEARPVLQAEHLDADAIDELIESAAEHGDLATLERLADQGNATAIDQLIESAAEHGNLAILERLASQGNKTAAEVLEELTEE